MYYQGLINKYRAFLPVSDKTPVITLNEGNTPLIKAEKLAKKIGADFEIYLKFDGCNPTGSFKDRGMTLAVSKAKESGAGAIICASTGNTSASAAAYGAKAGLKTFVIVPDGLVAPSKLSQALMYGAEIIAVQGSFDRAFDFVKQICEKYPITLVNSLNQNRIEGQKTGAFEIIESFDDAPDYHFVPVGNAGNMTAYWKGYKEFNGLKKAEKLPKIIGIQAKGCAPIVEGRIIETPQTLATAIRVGNPASWQSALKAKDESKGAIDCVSDEEIISTYKLIASCEGVFAEPSSASSVAGMIKFKNQIKSGSKVVCVLTGSGLKDSDSALKFANSKIKKSPANIDEILKVMDI